MSSCWDIARDNRVLTVDDIDAMYSAHRGGPVSDRISVHFCVPTYREPWRVVQRVLNAIGKIQVDLAEHGITSSLSTIDGDSLVCRMRQRAMHAWLKTSDTHMVFCDGDIEALDPTCVRMMLASGHDIVAGACPFKEPTGRVVCNLKPGQLEALHEAGSVSLPGGCIEVQDAGTGFMMFSRKAIYRMMSNNMALIHWSRSKEDYDEPLWALFDTGVVNGVYESEDYRFCRLWQALGGKVYVYIPAEFAHHGEYAYRGAFTKWFGFSQE